MNIGLIVGDAVQIFLLLYVAVNILSVFVVARSDGEITVRSLVACLLVGSFWLFLVLVDALPNIGSIVIWKQKRDIYS